MLFEINNSTLYYKNTVNYVECYFLYIVELIKQILINNTLHLNIIIGDDEYNFNNNNNKTLRIDINYEHTLVKQGGRDTYDSPLGLVVDDSGKHYLIRIYNFDKLNKADIIIDYSIINIINVKSNAIFHNFASKHIYISTSIYDFYVNKENRNITTLTTFMNTEEPRRKHLIEQFNDKQIGHRNINNCFDKHELQSLYKNTKILINIHQTEHHHTLEELRVLPALQCGVIVICENSPLSENVPYNDYIIWSSYDDILNKTIDIMNNYDYYHDRIFHSNKKIDLNDLNEINLQILSAKLKGNN